MLKPESGLPHVKSTNSDDGCLENVRIFDSDYVALYVANTEVIPILFRGAPNLARTVAKPAPFHECIFQTRSRIFLVELKVLFFDHRKNSSREFLGLSKTPMSQTRTTSITLLKGLHLHRSTL